MGRKLELSDKDCEWIEENWNEGDIVGPIKTRIRDAVIAVKPPKSRTVELSDDTYTYRSNIDDWADDWVDSEDDTVTQALSTAIERIWELEHPEATP